MMEKYLLKVQRQCHSKAPVLLGESVEVNDRYAWESKELLDHWGYAPTESTWHPLLTTLQQCNFINIITLSNKRNALQTKD